MTANSEEPTSLLVQLQADRRWIDVGWLLSRHDTTWFESSPHYWHLPRRPVLGQIFEQHPQTWRPRATTALPRWFSHLLSEGRLREAAARALGIHPSRELPLLAALGADDLPGAVRVVRADDTGRGLDPDADDVSQASTDDDPVLKFSLAGLHLKFSLTRSERGLTVPVSGSAGDVILKLPDTRPGFDGVPEAEFAAMSLAQRAGIRVPEIALVDAREVRGLEAWAGAVAGPSFTIARYDRLPDAGRVHAEELAQVFDISATHPRVKYTHTNAESVANAVARLAGLEDVIEVIRRLVLNVLVGNGDAHLKNWAFVYPDGQNPRLSPLYDVVPTVLYLSGDALALNLDGSKDFSSVTPDSFRRLGERTGLGAGVARDAAREAVERTLDHWGVLRESLRPDQADLLDRRLATLPLARGRSL